MVADIDPEKAVEFYQTLVLILQGGDTVTFKPVNHFGLAVKAEIIDSDNEQVTTRTNSDLFTAFINAADGQ